MGLSSAPDIFQSIMTGLFHDLDYVLVYLGYILIIQKEGETEDDHLQKVEEVLKRLEDKGLRASLRNLSLCNKRLNTLVIY